MRQMKYVIGIGLMRALSRWPRLAWWLLWPLAPLLAWRAYRQNPQRAADDQTLARLGRFHHSGQAFLRAKRWDLPRKTILGVMQLLRWQTLTVAGMDALVRRCQTDQRGAVVLGMHHHGLLAVAVFSRLQGVPCRSLVSAASYHLFRSSHDEIPAGYRHPCWEIDPRQSCFSTVTDMKAVVTLLRQGGVVNIFADSEVPPSKAQTAVISLFGLPRRISLFPFRLALKEQRPVYVFGKRWRSDNSGYDYAIEPFPTFATPQEGARLYQDWMSALLVGQEADYDTWWWLEQRYQDCDGSSPPPHRELAEALFDRGEKGEPKI